MANERKHPVCMVKGCDRLQSAAVELAPPKVPSGSVNIDIMDTSPFEVRVCLKHFRLITEGETDVSCSTKEQ